MVPLVEASGNKEIQQLKCLKNQDPAVSINIISK